MSPAEKQLDERWSDLSDQYLKDAANEDQSMHGRISCAFEAGYFAVLRCLGPDAQHRYEHPDIGALRALDRRCNADVGIALKFLTHRYDSDPEQLPALPAMLIWAQTMRGLAKIKAEFAASGHFLGQCPPLDASEDSVEARAAKRKAEMPDAIEVDPNHL